jgi:CBS domain containing-hemolysin-like protein
MTVRYPDADAVRVTVRIEGRGLETEVSREFGIETDQVVVNTLAGGLIQQITEIPDLGKLTHQLAEAAVRVHHLNGLES